MSYINKKIAEVVKCNPESIKYLDNGEEVEVFLFTDNFGSKKTIKIYSKPISVKKGFDNVKKDLMEKTNLLRGVSKVLKPLSENEIELYGNKYYFQICNYMDMDLLNICNDRTNIVNNYELFLIALRIVMGIYSLHKASIVHCDIKVENILVNLKDKKVKLIDFGFIKKIKQNCFYVAQGTPVYAAPELKKIYGMAPGYMLFPADIYSLGIVLYAIFTKNIDLSKLYYYKKNSHIASLPYETPKIRRKFFELIERMVDKNPEVRPNIEEVRDIMVKIYLNIEKECKKRGAIENTKLKNREKIELGILNDINFKGEELEKMELNTLKRIKFLIEDNKMTDNLQYNLKKYINEIYSNDIFKIEEGDFRDLDFEEELNFHLMQIRLNNTKLAQSKYYNVEKINFENNKKFFCALNESINLFNTIKKEEREII